MKKTLFAGLLIAAIMAFGFTGCSNGDKNGTAPEFEDYFWTNNEPGEINDLSAVPKVKTITVDNGTTKYAEIIVFNDPDIDVEKIEYSLNENFEGELWYETDITQKYEDQITTFNGVSITSTTAGDFTIYVRLVDKKGNTSNVKSWTLTKVIN